MLVLGPTVITSLISTMTVDDDKYLADPLPAVNCSSQPDGKFLVDPQNCSHYYMCFSGQQHRQRCPSGLYFDDNLNSCNLEKLVHCVQQIGKALRLKQTVVRTEELLGATELYGNIENATTIACTATSITTPFERDNHQKLLLNEEFGVSDFSTINDLFTSVNSSASSGNTAENSNETLFTFIIKNIQKNFILYFKMS